MKYRPPILAELLFSSMIDTEDDFSILGDFGEEFYEIVKVKGVIYGKMWYWYHVIRSLPQLVKESFFRSTIMFKNYFKTAKRSFFKNKLNSGINLFGLSLGLACCILLYLYVNNETTYDTSYDRHEDIYIMTRIAKGDRGELLLGDCPIPLSQKLKTTFPEIELMSNYLYEGAKVRKGEIKISENIFFVEQDFFDIFSLNVP